MASSYDVVQAAQSENIIVVVAKGVGYEELKIPKELIGRTSQYLVKLIEQDGSLNFQQYPEAAVRMWMRRCYQTHLELDANTKGEARHNLKNDLIELWIFCVKFGIFKLQNEAMQSLLSNLTVPFLIRKRDVERVWNENNIGDNGLKWFVIYALVAQMEEGADEKKARIEQLGGFLKKPDFAPDFAIMLYKAQKQWHKYEIPKTPKKGKGRTKWSIFVAGEDVKKAVMVNERKLVAVNASEGAKETVMPVRETSAVAVKREAPEGGEEDGSPSKKAKGFTQGEVISLLDDD